MQPPGSSVDDPPPHAPLYGLDIPTRYTEIPQPSFGAEAGEYTGRRACDRPSIAAVWSVMAKEFGYVALALALIKTPNDGPTDDLVR